MDFINEFLKKKWAKWVIAGVALIIIFIIFPQILAAMIPLLGAVIPLTIALIAYRKMKPKPQKTADETEFREYCYNELNAHEMHNLIISGGKSSDRFLAVAKILNEASKKRIPTIVLHSGFVPFSQFSQDTYYDPCVGADTDEIAEILTDTAVALNIDSVVQSSLKFMADVLKAVKGDFTLSDVVEFPYDDVMSYLDDCKVNSLTDIQYDNFRKRYNNPAIKDNILRVVPLMSRLKPLTQQSKAAKPINFREAVVEKQILFFDLLTDSNPVLKELVFSAINKLTEVSKFWVITEGISFIGKPESKVDTVFTKNQNNITLVYSGDDVPSLTAQTENVFETLTGGKAKMLLFAHPSARSAKRWSEHFGEINKTKINSTVVRGTFQIGSNKGSSVGTEKDYKFPPEHFMKLAKTTDINNRTVYWGLNEGECYFVQDSMAITETKNKKTGFFTNMMGLAGHDTHDTYLPKIALESTPLQIESRAS